MGCGALWQCGAVYGSLGPPSLPRHGHGGSGTWLRQHPVPHSAPCDCMHTAAGSSQCGRVALLSEVPHPSSCMACQLSVCTSTPRATVPLLCCSPVRCAGQRRTLQVWAELPRAGGLAPGMSSPSRRCSPWTPSRSPLPPPTPPPHPTPHPPPPPNPEIPPSCRCTSSAAPPPTGVCVCVWHMARPQLDWMWAQRTAPRASAGALPHPPARCCCCDAYRGAPPFLAAWPGLCCWACGIDHLIRQNDRAHDILCCAETTSGTCAPPWPAWTHSSLRSGGRRGCHPASKPCHLPAGNDPQQHWQVLFVDRPGGPPAHFLTGCVLGWAAAQRPSARAGPTVKLLTSSYADMQQLVITADNFTYSAVTKITVLASLAAGLEAANGCRDIIHRIGWHTWAWMMREMVETLGGREAPCQPIPTWAVQGVRGGGHSMRSALPHHPCSSPPSLLLHLRFFVSFSWISPRHTARQEFREALHADDPRSTSRTPRPEWCDAV